MAEQWGNKNRDEAAVWDLWFPLQARATQPLHTRRRLFALATRMPGAVLRQRPNLSCLPPHLPSSSCVSALAFRSITLWLPLQIPRQWRPAPSRVALGPANTLPGPLAPHPHLITCLGASEGPTRSRKPVSLGGPSVPKASLSSTVVPHRPKTLRGRCPDTPVGWCASGVASSGDRYPGWLCLFAIGDGWLSRVA